MGLPGQCCSIIAIEKKKILICIYFIFLSSGLRSSDMGSQLRASHKEKKVSFPYGLTRQCCPVMAISITNNTLYP